MPFFSSAFASIRSPATVVPGYASVVEDRKALYTGPCRRAIPIILGLLIAYNFTTLILGCVATGLTSTGSIYFNGQYIWGPTYDFGDDSTSFRSSMFIFKTFCASVLIPLYLLTMAIVEAVLRRKRTLKPVHALVSSLIGLGCNIVYFFALGLWVHLDHSIGMYIWITLPFDIVYIVYMSFAAAAVDRARKDKRAAKKAAIATVDLESLQVHLDDIHREGPVPSTILTRPPSYMSQTTIFNEMTEVDTKPTLR